MLKSLSSPGMSYISLQINILNIHLKNLDGSSLYHWYLKSYEDDIVLKKTLLNTTINNILNVYATCMYPNDLMLIIRLNLLIFKVSQGLCHFHLLQRSKVTSIVLIAAGIHWTAFLKIPLKCLARAGLETAIIATNSEMPLSVGLLCNLRKSLFSFHYNKRWNVRCWRFISSSSLILPARAL